MKYSFLKNTDSSDNDSLSDLSISELCKKSDVKSCSNFNLSFCNTPTTTITPHTTIAPSIINQICTDPDVCCNIKPKFCS